MTMTYLQLIDVEIVSFGYYHLSLEENVCFFSKFIILFKKKKQPKKTLKIFRMYNCALCNLKVHVHEQI